MKMAVFPTKISPRGMSLDVAKELKSLADLYDSAGKEQFTFTFPASNTFTLFTKASPSKTYDLRGKGFAYDDAGPTAGTITHISLKKFADILFSIIDLSVPVATFKVWAKGPTFAEKFLAKNDEISGASANDKIIGLGGNDILRGNAGNDTLSGGAGKDKLTGGPGKDTLTGGPGADTFIYEFTTQSPKGPSRDTITDFSHAQRDRIDLSKIDADTDGTAGNQAFKFIGSKAFSGVDGELRSAKGVVQGDVDGDKIADFEIKVNVAELAKSDFVL